MCSSAIIHVHLHVDTLQDILIAFLILVTGIIRVAFYIQICTCDLKKGTHHFKMLTFAVNACCE